MAFFGPIKSPPQVQEDFPVAGSLVDEPGGSMGLSSLIYGAGAFSNQYNTDDHLASAIPLRTVRLALRYGIRVIDTSTYYGPSEIVLGNILQTVRSEFPRSSYQLMTKCGRYGMTEFDYSPDTIRASIARSLERLQTNYLDTVYLHDVEFVCTPCAPRTTGNHTSALKDDAAAYGLAEGDEAKIRGEGDQKILDAFHTLQELQSQGIVKNIGITGYPLATLLRLSILILHTAPFKPVDVLLSYSHICLQNATLLEFMPHFYERAKVGQVVAASPLNMGMLTPTPPSWHPAPSGLLVVAQDVRASWNGDFPNLAVGYSIRNTCSYQSPRRVPLVIGFSHPREVHECIRVWREVRAGGYDKSEREEGEKRAREGFRQAGYLDWSWASP